jgi:hypothetical protein
VREQKGREAAATDFVRAADWLAQQRALGTNSGRPWLRTRSAGLRLVISGRIRQVDRRAIALLTVSHCVIDFCQAVCRRCRSSSSGTA